MSRRRIALAIVVGLVTALLPAGFSQEAYANGQPTVVQPSDIAIAALVNHGDGSMTVTDCRIAAPYSNSSTPYAAITMDSSGQVINQVPKTVDGWTTKSCEESSVAGTDNTYFVSQSKNGLTNHRLVAYKNGAIRWNWSYSCSTGKNLAAQALVLGVDGNIYGVFYEPGTTCPELSAYKKMLIGIDVATGVELFRTTFSVTEEWAIVRLFAQADRLIVRTNKDLLFFEADGDALTAQTLTAGTAYSDRFLHQIGVNDSDTAIYVRETSAAVPRPTACTGFNKKHSMYVKQSASSEVNLNIPDCELIYDLEILPNGTIAYLYQDQATMEWRVKQRDVAGTVSSDIVVSGLSGYMVYMDALVESSDILTASGDGSLYLKRRLKAYPGNSLSDVNLRIDRISATGVLTQVFNTSEFDNPNTQQLYAPIGTPKGGLAGNKLYVPYCSGNSCNAYSAGKVAIADVSVGFDYPRSEIFADHQQLNYVALGDSFSSGEGVEPFDPNTAIPSTNECHRSEKSYSKLLVNVPGSKLRFNGFGFLACSGAMIGNVNGSDPLQYSTQPLSQISMLMDSVDVVAITAGGNNIDFDVTGYVCATDASALNCTDAILDSEAKVDSQLEQDLTDLYEEIRGAISENGEVFVVGYPQMFPSENIDENCTWGTTPGTSQRPMEQAELTGLHSVINNLNQRIEDAVEAAGEHVHYVNPAPYFIGHEICSDDPWFHNAVSHTEDFVFSFHPNELGQQAYARAVLNEMNVVLG